MNEFDIKTKIFNDFFVPEGKWIDEVVRQQFPAAIIWLAEKGLRSSLMKIILAKLSGLEVKRSPDYEMFLANKGGFRGSRSGYKVNGMRVKIFKKGRLLEERYFKLDLHISGEMSINLFKK